MLEKPKMGRELAPTTDRTTVSRLRLLRTMQRNGQLKKWRQLKNYSTVWVGAGRAGGGSAAGAVAPGARGPRGPKLMAPRTDRTTRIPSGVASPVTTNHAAKWST